MKNMVKPFGELERAVLVRSELTGQSKGYGIVEFTYKTAAEKAKAGLQSTQKHLRVDVANSGLNEYRDLQSQTLYVNQFPNDTTSEQIEEIVNKHVQVPFCKVGLLLNYIFLNADKRIKFILVQSCTEKRDIDTSLFMPFKDWYFEVYYPCRSMMDTFIVWG